MYPEFIAIYIMLAILVVMNAVTLLFLFLLMKKISTTQTADTAGYQQPVALYYNQSYVQQHPQQGSNVVFCPQCATQYDARQGYCPGCGARR